MSLQEWLLEWEKICHWESQGWKCLLLTKALNTKLSRANRKWWVITLQHVVYLQPCQLWEDSTNHGLFIVVWKGWVVCVCVCTRMYICVPGDRVVHFFLIDCQTKNKGFLLNFWKHVRFLLLNDYSAKLLLTYILAERLFRPQSFFNIKGKHVIWSQ